VEKIFDATIDNRRKVCIFGGGIVKILLRISHISQEISIEISVNIIKALCDVLGNFFTRGNKKLLLVEEEQRRRTMQYVTS